MGCGCKNKSGAAQTQVQNADPKVMESIKQQNSQSIKETIKKTVEKYYYTDKKSNGWVKG